MNKYQEALSAKEMFEELGFEYELTINEDYREVIYARCLSSSIYIKFDLETYCSVDINVFDKSKIKGEVMIAITQQMKELGWLDD